MKEMTALNAFQTDAIRLDEQQRAIRRKQGLEMRQADDDMGINNIIADNITITDGVKKGVVSEPKPETDPLPKPSLPERGNGSNARWLAGAALTIGGLLTAGNLGWMLGGGSDDNTGQQPNRPSPVIERDSVPLKVEYE